MAPPTPTKGAAHGGTGRKEVSADPLKAWPSSRMRSMRRPFSDT
jgi:hypothetical protein